MAFTQETTLSTEYGSLKVAYFKDGHKFCLCIYKKPWSTPTFVRLHSGCMFAESLHADDCDCNLQLQAALKIISEEGGVVVYLFQEGRGLGLEGKIMALELQRERDIDTAEAFKTLGAQPDLRDYTLAIHALEALAVPKEVSLGTGNPCKVRAFQDSGFKVTRRHIKVQTNPTIDKYLEMKQKVLDHFKDE